MNKETYDSLSAKERLIYDEFIAWSHSLMHRIDTLTEVVQKLLDVATQYPE